MARFDTGTRYQVGSTVSRPVGHTGIQKLPYAVPCWHYKTSTPTTGSHNQGYI